MTLFPTQLSFLWLAGCRAQEEDSSPCGGLTDRERKTDGGMVRNIGEIPFTVITSDFPQFGWARFRLPPGMESRSDLCVSDVDAIPFSAGIRVYVDGTLDNDLSREGEGVFRIRDGYEMRAGIMENGVLTVHYDSHPARELVGLGPETLTLEEAKSDLGLCLDPDCWIIPVSTGYLLKAR